MKLFILFILFSFLSIFPQQNMINKIDSLLLRYNKPSAPGAGVYISYAGKTIMKQGIGFAEIETNRKVSLSTNFRLASVTKQFTATAVLQLIARKQLSLETKLSDIFPEFPPYAKEISISHLLSHTSGLIDYEDLIHDTVTIQVRDNDVLSLMLNTDSTYFKPGSKWRYSNTAYSLLALTVERISAISFPDYLTKFIFQPLGMDNTVAFVDGINKVSERAYGYSKSGDTWIRTDQSVTSAVLGDGGIYSSVNDLIKWEKSLSNFSILDKKFVELATSRKQLNDSTIVNYGFGWHLKTFNGHEVIYHTGSTRGFRNIIYRIPELDLVIILLTNRDQGEEKSTEKISDEITTILLESKN